MDERSVSRMASEESQQETRDLSVTFQVYTDPEVEATTGGDAVIEPLSIVTSTVRCSYPISDSIEGLNQKKKLV